jgi:hypothetical protein
MDIFLLEEEVKPDNRTAMQSVIAAAEAEVDRLEQQSADLLEK